MPTTTHMIPGTDNDVSDDVDRRLTTLLERTVVRRAIHHANIAVASGDGRRCHVRAGAAGGGVART